MPLTPDGLLDLDKLHDLSDYAEAIREFPELDYSEYFRRDGQQGAGD